jgi:hypothetical protein
VLINGGCLDPRMGLMGKADASIPQYQREFKNKVWCLKTYYCPQVGYADNDCIIPIADNADSDDKLALSMVVIQLLSLLFVSSLCCNRSLASLRC